MQIGRTQKVNPHSLQIISSVKTVKIFILYVTPGRPFAIFSQKVFCMVCVRVHSLSDRLYQLTFLNLDLKYVIMLFLRNILRQLPAICRNVSTMKDYNVMYLFGNQYYLVIPFVGDRYTHVGTDMRDWYCTGNSNEYSFTMHSIN